MADHRVVICANSEAHHISLHLANRWCTAPVQDIVGLVVKPAGAPALAICGIIRQVENIYALCIAVPGAPHRHPADVRPDEKLPIQSISILEANVNDTGQGYTLKRGA